MEQREIKVCFLHTSMFWFGFLLFAIFIFLFVSPSGLCLFILHVLWFLLHYRFSFIEFLFCRHFSYVFFSLFPFCPPGCVSSAHLSSLHLHPPPPIIFFSSSLQFISLVSTQQGGCSSCFPTVHVCSSYAVDKIDSYWLLVCYHVVFRVTAAFL